MRQVDELEDVNEHLLGLALVRTMREPGHGMYFEEVAVALIETINAEGWVSAEDRDKAERARDAAEQQVRESNDVIEQQEQEILRLEKQVAVLVDQLSSRITTPTTGSGSGIYVSPSTPWVTYTSTSSAAVPAAEVAAQILAARRRRT